MVNGGRRWRTNDVALGQAFIDMPRSPWMTAKQEKELHSQDISYRGWNSRCQHRIQRRKLGDLKLSPRPARAIQRQMLYMSITQRSKGMSEV